MTDSDERTTAPGQDADADAATAADVIRVRMMRQGIRDQDVADAITWARATRDTASPH